MWCVWIAASCRGSDISEHLLLLLVVMMEVSATSLLVILGIFCSSALAQPSPELQQAMNCMGMASRECLMPVVTQYRGMNFRQLLNQIRNTDLAQTCGPVLTANQCLLNKVNECGLNEFESEPIFASGLRQLRSASVVVNYICRDHVEVFNENKACLVNMAGNENLRDQLEQCPEPPRPSPTRPFCIPQGLPECVANIVQQECGEEIANEFRSLGQQVLAEAGCPAHKLFKLMKKEKYSPVEMMYKAFPSFF